MSTPITEYCAVTVTVADRLIQQIDFGTVAIFDEFVEPAAWDTGQRSQEYSTLAAVAADFATTTKVYKMAAALFTADAEYPAPSSVKVLRAASGDANLTASLDAIALADPDWYALAASYRVEADINEIAAWISTASNPHLYFACSEDAGVLDGADATDIASDLQGFAYDRVAYVWHHQGGHEPTITSLTVSVLRTVTAAATGHTLLVGDPITIAGATDFGSDADILNGNFVVATVPTANSFTYTLSSDATDGLATGTITCSARYTFPEVRAMGLGIPQTAGWGTWAFKTLVGRTPAPTTLLNLTQQRAAIAKNANIYTTIAGLGAFQTGKCASGRFIDIQQGIDWTAVRIAEAINQRLLASKKVPYTDGGFEILRGDITQVLQTGLNNGLFGDRLVGDVEGRAWIIDIPALEDIPAADRASRTLPDVNVTVRFAGAIHNVQIAVSAGL